MNAPIHRIKTAAEEAIAKNFAATGAGASPAGPRGKAFARFEATGLPTKRMEAWHYTDLRAAMREAYPYTPTRGSVLESRKGALAAGIDGVRDQALSEVMDRHDDPLFAMLAPPTGADDPMVALNAAMAHSGRIRIIAAGRKIETPLVEAFAADDASPHAEYIRSLYVVEAGAAVKIVERHASQSKTQRNNVMVINVAKGASVEHIFIAQNHKAESHVATLIVELAEGATFRSTAVITEAPFLRRQIFASLHGEGAKISLAGASLLQGRQHVDTTIVVDHLVPNGESRELFKHILFDEAVGVFQGKVHVRPAAQKTDGGMKSQTLLLSDDAAMYNKPELEIYADDVVCGHGATVGQPDEDQLFYLMSRGLPRSQAEALLIEAFVREPIDAIGDDGLRQECEAEITGWLEARQ